MLFEIGQQFYQYQQNDRPVLASNLGTQKWPEHSEWQWKLVSNFTNISKMKLPPHLKSLNAKILYASINFPPPSPPQINL